jgi:hypothetical protein
MLRLHAAGTAAGTRGGTLAGELIENVLHRPNPLSRFCLAGDGRGRHIRARAIPDGAIR